jgi:mannose-1-phosphate guanylyltransferase
MIVLGIRPQWPETGFGYIEFAPGIRPGSLELLPVLKFREKPDLETARDYVASGRFFWNAGMFFWRADVFLDSLARRLPRTARVIAGLPAFDTRGFASRLREAFPRCDNISVDYAILEKEQGVAGLAAEDIRWNDVGSWNALYELTPRDRDGNAARSEILAQASTGNLVDVPGKFTALLGVSDLVVVETSDALLIASRHSAQKVGDVVKALEKRRRFELL